MRTPRTKEETLKIKIKELKRTIRFLRHEIQEADSLNFNAMAQLRLKEAINDTRYTFT